MMLGRTVRVADAGNVPPEGVIPVAVAPYIDAENRLLACAWVDLPLGAAMGAAMSMVEAVGVQHCLEAGVIPPEFQDNLREVLNIATALLNTDEVAPLTIRGLELLEKGLSEDVLELLADPRAGGYYTVEVAEYGKGILSFTLA
jgi:hypothetical protein